MNYELKKSSAIARHRQPSPERWRRMSYLCIVKTNEKSTAVEDENIGVEGAKHRCRKGKTTALFSEDKNGRKPAAFGS